MSQVIGGTYQIIEKIGAGGGGLVYLGHHLRLDKKIILKADRRISHSKMESLRREVDALKNLSHTYIPQVYDFLIEDGVAYTVMDFVEGESLEKPLKRGEYFSQSQVIAWACQILEALEYLHSREPNGILHADIKPANIMLTPQGDIRLIDYNIALALGETGAVAVGRSFGYASPEHYSLELQVTEQGRAVATQIETEVDETSVETQWEKRQYSGEYSGSASSNPVFLDVRSDVYSLGATLYHLLTGRRPPKEIISDVYFPQNEVSVAVQKIVKKAISINPEDRYQTAQEMHEAFLSLWDNDPRMVGHRHKVRLATAVLSVALIVGGGMTFMGLKQMELDQAAQLGAAQSASALQQGNAETAVDLALEALSKSQTYTAQAQKALTDALGVYDLTDGYKLYKVVEQDSETIQVTISPQGTVAAAFCAFTLSIIDTETGEVMVELPTVQSALADMIFVTETTLLYSGETGITLYDIANNTVIWQGDLATDIALSSDGTTVATVYGDAGEAIIYSIDGIELQRVSFGNSKQSVPINAILGNANDNIFALKGDGTQLAVSLEEGVLTVYDLTGAEQHLQLYDSGVNAHFEGGFYGDYLAFSVTDGDGSLFAIVDTVAQAQTGGFYLTSKVGVKTDEFGIYLSNENVVVSIHPETGEQVELAYTGDAQVTDFAKGTQYTLVLTDDGGYSFFDQTATLLGKQIDEDHGNQYGALAGEYAIVGGLETALVNILQLENHADATVFTYDPSYTHDEARLSEDGTQAIFFQYTGFRIVSDDGTVINTVDMPYAENIYDQQYLRTDDGDQLVVTYYDGTIMTYNAETGILLSTEQGEEPDKSLLQIYEFDLWRIEAPLHGAATVYDASTGAEIAQLQSDAYLTYVTQVGDYAVAEYISALGERYGLLLNNQWETLAELPNLCDIVGETLIFDTQRGELRQTQIYSIDELLVLTEIFRES